MNSTPCSSLSPSIFCPKLPKYPTRYPAEHNTPRLRKNAITIRFASKPDGYGHGHGHGQDYGGKLVDDNIAVLRKRIQEMRVAERIDPDPPEDGWTGWEQSYSEGGSYGSDVCQAVGLIQMLAMSVRPGVAMGLVGLMLCSVPVSAVLVGVHLGQALKLLVH